MIGESGLRQYRSFLRGVLSTETSFYLIDPVLTYWQFIIYIVFSTESSFSTMYASIHMDGQCLVIMSNKDMLFICVESMFGYFWYYHTCSSLYLLFTRAPDSLACTLSLTTSCPIAAIEAVSNYLYEQCEEVLVIVYVHTQIK